MEELAAIGGFIGGVGGLIGGIVMPVILGRMKQARLDREARDLRLEASFGRLEGMMRHLDECLENKTESLRSQISGVHLEVAKEYASKPDLNRLETNLREEIDVAGRLSKIEDRLRTR